ncbi:MAG TPA: TspO/MBR family protein [Chthoniobacterales bacterium]|nr:TspO/MBR family protein [Chthoniobacterales bacterium]
MICAIGAGLEGLFAGGGVKRRLASLRMPAYAVPFWGWVLIGGMYYVICFVIWTRLFLLPHSPARSIAFVLLAKMMFINAFWNYLFFRARHLQFAYLIGVPYGAMALVLFFLLLKLDGTAAWCLSPYLTYLIYGNLWGYRVWRLNPN